MHKISKRIKILVVVLLGVLVASGVVLGAYLYFHSLQAEELRESLIANCEKNGNPLRQGLQEEKEQELFEAEHPEQKVLDALHLSKLQAIELSQPRIKILNKDIERYAPIDCKEQFDK